MKKASIILISLVLIATSASAQQVKSQEQVKPGLKPGDMFYWVENIVEKAEVQIAGFIGGSDLKAKAIANNAEERLAEAKALEKNNKTEKVDELRRKYSEQINKSKKLADQKKNPKLTEKLDNITKKNQKVLEKVKNKTPEQAQRGLRKEKNKTGNKKSPVKKPDISEKASENRNLSQKGRDQQENMKNSNKSEKLGKELVETKNNSETEIKSGERGKTSKPRSNASKPVDEVSKDMDSSKESSGTDSSPQDDEGKIEKPESASGLP